MVFGPSAEKRTLAINSLIREFPRCPICKGTYGYEISGSSLNYFKCNGCQAKWESNPLHADFVLSMTLLQPSGYDLRGIELVGMNCQSVFYKNFDASYGNFLKNWRSRMTGELGSRVSLEIDEEIVWSWPGAIWVRTPSPLQQIVGQVLPFQFAQHSGQLFLTNERLIWIQEGMFNFEVPLEDLTSFAVAVTYKGASESCIVNKILAKEC